MNKTHLILGMSHVTCLKNALSKDENEYIDALLFTQNFYLDKLFERYGSNPEEKTQDPSKIFLCIDGNQHNAFSLLEHPKKYIVGNTAEDDSLSNSDRVFVPADVIADVLRQRMEPTFQLEKALHERFSGSDIAHIAPPPPLSDANHIKNHPGIFKDRLHLGVAPKLLRLSIYQIQMQLCKEQAAKLGSRFIEAPDQAIDEYGLLKSEYFNLDPTHGNIAYGRLMLDKILSGKDN